MYIRKGKCEDILIIKTLKRLTFSLALIFLASCGDSNRSDSLTIGTNPAGTFYYVVGTGLSKLFNESLGVRSTAQPASGSAVYVPLINNGEMSLGFSTSIEAGSYFNGQLNLTEQPNLRVLMKFWVMPYGYMVRADSGIKHLADLKGKNVVDEQSANLTLSIGNRLMLQSAGLDVNDYNAITVGGLPQGITAVTDGLADAAPIALGQGNVRKAHATTPGGIQFLDMSDIDSVQDFFANQKKGFNAYTVSEDDQLPGASEGLITGSVDIYLISSVSMSEEIAEDIISVIENNWQSLENQFAALKRGSPSMFVDENHTIPYHQGAVNYYKKKGLWSDVLEERNQMLLLSQ